MKFLGKLNMKIPGGLFVLPLEEGKVCNRAAVARFSNSFTAFRNEDNHVFSRLKSVEVRFQGRNR